MRTSSRGGRMVSCDLETAGMTQIIKIKKRAGPPRLAAVWIAFPATKVVIRRGSRLIGLFFVEAMRVVVVTVPVAVKNERHQTAADQQREQHPADDGDISVQRYWLATEPDPCGAREPDRQSQQCQQGHDHQKRTHHPVI